MNGRRKNEQKKRWSDGNKTGAAIILLFCLFVWLEGGAASAQESDAEDIAGYLAAVFSYDSEGNYTGMANGIFLDDGGKTIVVAYDDGRWETSGEIIALSVNGTKGFLTLLQTVDEMGLAIFEMDEYGGISQEDAVSFDSLSRGETVYCGGLELTSSSDNMYDWISLQENSVSDAGRLEEYIFVELSGSVDSMYAGGPVLNSSGKLVGILSGRSGGNLFVPIDYFLSVTGSGNTDPAGSTETAEGTGAASGSGGENAGGEASGSSQVETVYVTSDSPVLSALFLILFFGGITVFVVSTILYLNQETKRRAGGHREFEEGELSQNAGGAARQIVGTGGYFNGRSFSVSGRAVTFGRDASRCNAVYPADTKGVSGLHCRVEQTGGRIFLTDLGSTYGTFLKNGTRLQPDTPQELKQGDTFYLATPSNTFQVR